MTYVLGYDFDIFVSYAHVDNEPIESAEHGWVDALTRILTIDLGMKVGRSELLSVWRDEQNLRGNHEVRGHIPEQVKRSALFLAILSPGYVSSRFCLLELKTFLDGLGGTGAERLFVVYKEPLDEQRHKMPEAFRDPRKYQFWVPDRHQKPRVLGWPLPRHDVPEDRQLFYPKIGDLSSDIVSKLEELRTSSSRPNGGISEAARGSSAPTIVAQLLKPAATIVVAEVTDDLDARRDEVRRYLLQENIEVLPAGSYRLARADFEAAATADLRKSAAFVQLLGEFAGKCPPDVPDGYGWLQFELAKSAKLPILQWRSPELDVSAVASPQQQRLLQAETVQSIPFEDFKRTIVQTISRKEEPRKPRPSFLFINADRVDMEYAQAILEGVGDNFDWAMPLWDPEAKADQIQEYVETNLIDCDGLVIVYGKSRPDWVTKQLQLYRKLAPRRAKEPSVLALVKAPPESKPAIPMGLRGWLTLGFEEASARIKTALAS
jgi:hypothetical protein